MKRLKLLALGGAFILTFSQLYAQIGEGGMRKSSAISYVLAVPVGDFGSTDINKGGFATNGSGIAFDSKSFVIGNLYLLSHSSYNWINLDEGKLSEEFTSVLGQNTSIIGGQHKPFFSTLGAGYDIKISDRFKIGVNASCGILYNSFKPMTITVTDASNNVLYQDVMKFDSDLSFSYSFGATGETTLVPDKLSFFFATDYIAGKVDTYLQSRNIAPIKAMETLELFNFNFGIIVYPEN